LIFQISHLTKLPSVSESQWVASANQTANLHPVFISWRGHQERETEPVSSGIKNSYHAAARERARKRERERERERVGERERERERERELG
jgi:hypothetical protein